MIKIALLAIMALSSALSAEQYYLEIKHIPTNSVKAINATTEFQITEESEHKFLTDWYKRFAKDMKVPYIKSEYLITQLRLVK